jgi:adenosylmethionine-8-amino-7-oxononanoate aminotransferase
VQIMTVTTPSTDRYSFVPGSSGLPVIVGADGCWLHTADGRRILDGAGGAIVGNIGWGRREVAEAAAAAMVNGYAVPLWPTPARLALRDRLVDHWLPDGFSQVFFTSGGSESTDSALRLARAYQVAMGRPERWQVAGRHPSYHGMTLGTIAVASHSHRQRGFEPMLLDFPKLPWDDADAAVAIIDRHADTLAGVIAEPITGAAGACLTATDEYWAAITDACRRHDLLLIADEVMTGYGRTGTTWGHQQFPSFGPDVIVGGKGLGGGYVPIGAVCTTEPVASALSASGFMFFTFTGNDGACAAADAVLQIMQRERLVERVAVLGPQLEARLRAALGDHRHVVDIRGRGLFWGIELRCSKDAVVQAAMARDLWVYPAGSGPVADAVMVAPPFVVSDAELDELVARLTAALDSLP